MVLQVRQNSKMAIFVLEKFGDRLCQGARVGQSAKKGAILVRVAVEHFTKTLGHGKYDRRWHFPGRTSLPRFDAGTRDHLQPREK